MRYPIPSYLTALGSSRRCWTFKIKELIGNIAVRVEFPQHVEDHHFVHIGHTKWYIDQTKDITFERPVTAHLQLEKDGNKIIENGQIIDHRRKRKNYHFSALPCNALTHEAQWQQIRHFFDEDGNITETLHY